MERGAGGSEGEAVRGTPPIGGIKRGGKATVVVTQVESG
jgi:hypothetical protein